MNLNKQQKSLLANVTNIFNVLVKVNTPEEVIRTEMAQWIADFEEQVPEARLNLVLGSNPRVEWFDCSRDSAKVFKDANQNKVLRARIFNTRINATIGARENEISNSTTAQALRELARMIDQLPFELSEREDVDLFEFLGLGKTSDEQEDDDQIKALGEGDSGSLDQEAGESDLKPIISLMMTTEDN